MSQDVFILGGKRTPMGEYVGALKDISAIDLGATAAKAALEATGADARGFAITAMTADDSRLADPAALGTARVIVVVGTRGMERAARAAIAGACAAARETSTPARRRTGGPTPSTA